MNGIITEKKKSPNLRHGHVFSPKSRAYFAWEKGQIDTGMLNQREAGKFFPALVSGLADTLAATDTLSSLPPRDGEIASANQMNGNMLDQPGTHWEKHNVESSQLLPISWSYSAQHATRRWNYFITRKDWDPNLPLSRAQFEDTPFYQVQLSEQPFWEYGAALNPPNPTEHKIMLPERVGYHVILAVWEVANTGNAFYHVIDLNFVGGNVTPEPVAPAGLRCTGVTTSSVSLAWSAPSVPTASYRIYRNGTLIGSQTATTFTDSALTENTRFDYQLSSVDASGTESALSEVLSVTTLSTDAVDAPPSAPANLHSMEITTESVSLMWGGAQFGERVQAYIIYREGDEVARVERSQLTYKDKELQANTRYRYFVAAVDVQGRLSVPSNVLTITTDAEQEVIPEPVPEGYRAWALGETYAAAEVVKHNDLLWSCLQGHIAWVDSWAPGASDSTTLWQRA
ncbi:lytic polysaccharide monooxygenase [Yersinia hibernica]|uniref:lytic polysaccharide monooxygenase n=1 Tax=Yersinia hibernica TaxID=2339259 RepID=UPI001FE48685|nr:lytic polysaccharide monooxygenase [Yersinia hibernica]